MNQIRLHSHHPRHRYQLALPPPDKPPPDHELALELGDAALLPDGLQDDDVPPPDDVAPPDDVLPPPGDVVPPPDEVVPAPLGRLPEGLEPAWAGLPPPPAVGLVPPPPVGLGSIGFGRTRGAIGFGIGAGGAGIMGTGIATGRRPLFAPLPWAFVRR